VEALKNPRFWLLVWGAIGAIAIIYFIIAASVQPRQEKALSAINHDQALLTGEMADFVYAFPPRGAPSVPFLDEGKNITLNQFRGRTVLVNFWATWCAPCLKELPSLDRLQGELGGRKFEVVAIAADPRGAEVAQEFLDRLEIKNLKLYSDPTLAMASSVGGVNVMPISILYDAKGQEVGRLIGEADWMSPEAVRLVASAIP